MQNMHTMGTMEIFKSLRCTELVVHACNLSYAGGVGRRISP
jgi:hypothetical protein